MIPCDGEVMQIAAPAIVAAQDGADNGFALASDEAHAWIALKKKCDVRFGV